MRKLTYWVAPVKNDSSSYNMRARTKRELIELVDESGEKAWLRFDKPSKVVVEYRDAFDLLSACLGEGGITEPYAVVDSFEERFASRPTRTRDEKEDD